MDPLRRAEDSQEVSAGDKVRSRNKHGLVLRFGFFPSPFARSVSVLPGPMEG